jgi:outer membrane murein-binding lipoprotein Lpp/uncharacterized protein (DUF2141 family)
MGGAAKLTRKMSGKLLFENKAKTAATALIALLLLSTVAALFLSAIPIAMAEATIQVSPTSGAPGTKVTVRGSGFSQGEEVRIYFDTTQVNATTAVGAEGEIEATFTVPAVAYGSYTVKAVGQSSGYTAEAAFHVTRLVLSPMSGYVGDIVTVEGFGLKPNAYARIYFDKDGDKAMDSDEIVAIVPTDSNGHFITSFKVPAAFGGSHIVNAIASPDGMNEIQDWYASIDFKILPRIWLSPTSGPSGIRVKVYGNGFSANAQNVTIFFDKNRNGKMDVDEKVARASEALGIHIGTNSTGGLMNFTANTRYLVFTVPNVPYNTYTVWVNDTEGFIASATFIVGPASITLTPSTGIVGALVYVTGVGFTPGQTVELKMDDTTVSFITTVIVGPDGTFSGSFYVPPLSKGPGTYDVTASDGYVSAKATFTIPAPRITLNATQLPPGGALRITGENFGNSSQGYDVAVYLNTTSVTPVESSVDKDGRIDVNLTIPTYAGPLVYIVNVTLSDGTSLYRQFNATAILTVPKAYITLSPSSGTPGTTVTINGYWFQVGESVLALFDDRLLTLTPSPVKVKPDGTFTASFVVPSVVSGPHTVGVIAGTTSATATFNVVSTDVQVIMSAIEALERKLDNVLSNLTSPDFGLSTIKAAISLISSKLGAFSGTDTVASLLYEIKASVSAINWADITAIKGAVEALPSKIDSAKEEILTAIRGISVDLTSIMSKLTTIEGKLGDIEGKLDRLPAFGDLVTKNWADLTGYIDSAKSEILTAISGIRVDLTPVLDAISGLNAKLGAFSGTDTVASLLYDIRGRLEAITPGAQAASGSGATQFTSSQSVVIYSGEKVGTVTVSIKTSGVTYGERLVIRYYLDNTNYIEKVVTSSRDTAGWTDTAAAMMVELVYTWRSGTDTVYYAYSVIYPPSS